MMGHMKEDEFASSKSHIHGRTVALHLLEEPEAEEEPPSRVVAAGNGAATHPSHSEAWKESADGAFDVSPRSMAFCRRHFPDATVAQWNDWKWQLRNRLKDLRTLEK